MFGPTNLGGFKWSFNLIDFLSVAKKLKNLIFEISRIQQSLNINN